jgi:hypothetical protein
MKLTALISIFSLLFLSVHVTVDHALVEYCHLACGHSEAASHREEISTEGCAHHSLSHDHNGSADPHAGHCHSNHGYFSRVAFAYLIQDLIPAAAAPSLIQEMSSVFAASLPVFDIAWCPPAGAKACISFSSLQI